MAATFDYSIFTNKMVGLSIFYCDPTGTWWERYTWIPGKFLTTQERTHAHLVELLADKKYFEKLSPESEQLIITRAHYIIYQHMRLGGRDFLIARFYQYNIDEPIWEDIVGRAL